MSRGDEIQLALGILNLNIEADGVDPTRVGEVATAQTAPITPAAPNVPAVAQAGQEAGGSPADAVGSPGGPQPSAALRTSGFAETVLRADGVRTTLAAGVFLGAGAFRGQSVGTLLIAGAIAEEDQGGAATAFEVTTNGGATWRDVLDGNTVSPGNRFLFTVPVTPGDIVDFATVSASAIDSLRVVYQDGILASQTGSASSAGSVNLTEIGGTGVTGADWTPLFQASADAVGTPGSAVPARGVQFAGSDGTDVRVPLVAPNNSSGPETPNVLVIGGIAPGNYVEALSLPFTPAGADGVAVDSYFGQAVQAYLSALNPGGTADRVRVLGGTTGILATPFSGTAQKYITTATTTVVKNGPGVIGTIANATGTVTGTVTVYDNTAGSGNVVWEGTVPAGQPIQLGFPCATGITIVTADADAIAVSYA